MSNEQENNQMKSRSSNIARTKDLNRRGFGLKNEITPVLDATYTSDLVTYIRENGYVLSVGDLTFRLAKEFGFCYGVDRAVLFAYETRKKFPDRQIFLTTEIIHNPRVNQNLVDLGIRFFSGGYGGDTTIDDVGEGDVVLLPAFGTTVQEIDLLREKKCILVDTTCGSVMNVWRQVERNARDGFTSVIHGKKEHEETVATSSRAVESDDSAYLVVRNEDETQKVCDFIRNGGDRDQFLECFQGAYSKGFDPDRHLKRIGVANQTTMLSSESLHISDLLEQAVRDREGREDIGDCFRKFDTICTATQERQDAILEFANDPPDIFLVIGGFNSSNTTHLAAIASSFAPTYHVSDSDCLISDHTIRCKNSKTYAIEESENWLPKGPITIGVTAGASTPDRVMADVILRAVELRGCSQHLPQFAGAGQSPGLNLPVINS